MKKYLYSMAVFATIMISVISANLINLKNNDDIGRISLVNIDALASGENSGQPMDCYSNIQSTNDGRPQETQTYCGDCEPTNCTYWSNVSRCMR
jgi:hypothetical protein